MHFECIIFNREKIKKNVFTFSCEDVTYGRMGGIYIYIIHFGEIHNIPSRERAKRRIHAHSFIFLQYYEISNMWTYKNPVVD